MHCPRCGTAAVPGAAFCVRCGFNLASIGTQPHEVRVPTGPQPAYVPRPRRKSQWWGVPLIVGAMLLVLAIGLFGTGILRLPGQQPASTLPLKGSPSAAVTPQVGEVVTMPQDIRDWLEHLRQIEERKNDISRRQINEMLIFGTKIKALGAAAGLLDSTRDPEESDPGKATQSEFQDLRPDWLQLIEDFAAYPPPKECEPIAQDYARALNEIPAITADLNNVLLTVETNPEEALDTVTRMQNQSQYQIDQFLEKTDDKVQQICDKYNTRKWFEIKTDVGSGILGKLGF